MDKITHEVRLSHWRTIIESCQARPEGQTAKQWLVENGISDKQYYYWLRRARQEAYCSKAEHSLPAVSARNDVVLTEITGVTDEIPHSISCFTPDAVIHVMNVTIELSNSASAVLVNRVMKAVGHAV